MKPAKIRSLSAMLEEREALRHAGRVLVFTNGCFDILHPGHVRYLRDARELGDKLVVAVNDDESVKTLKGDTRPFLSLDERMEILAALEAVDYVLPFGEPTPLALIDALVPDVLVKGGDWSPDRIVGRETVERAGGRVLSLPFAEGFSTTGIIERIISRLGKRG